MFRNYSFTIHVPQCFSVTIMLMYICAHFPATSHMLPQVLHHPHTVTPPHCEWGTSWPCRNRESETTKDLGKALGVMLYVFNCSEQMDYKVASPPLPPFLTLPPCSPPPVCLEHCEVYMLCKCHCHKSVVALVLK